MSNLIPAKPENIQWMRSVIYGGLSEDVIKRGVAAYVNYRAMRGCDATIDVRDMIETVLRSSLGELGNGYSEDQNS